MPPEEREIRQRQVVGEVARAVGSFGQFLEKNQVGFPDGECRQHDGVVRGDGITRRQIAGAGVELERRIERIDQSLVQEQVLVKGILPLLVQLGEPGLGVQVVEQSAHLLDGRFSAQPVSQLAEVEQVDKERLVQ